MLEIVEIHHLSYLYLLYRSLDIELPHWKLTKEYLFVHVQRLFTEDTGSLTYCTPAQLEQYCEELARAIATAPTPFSFKGYTQEKNLRDRIAFYHTLEALSREGLASIREDRLLVGQFAAIGGISRERSEAFFDYLCEVVEGGVPATLKAVS